MNELVAQDLAHNRLTMLVLGCCEQMPNQIKTDFAFALFLQLYGFCSKM